VTSKAAGINETECAAVEPSIPNGYKRTEVGVIPGDWEIKQIGSLKPFITSGSRGWAAFYSDRGSPFIRITNLSRNSIDLDLEDLRFVNVASDDGEVARTKLQDDDVLISITADIGIVGYVSPRVPKPAYINQHIALVRFDPEKTSPKFVSYFLASERPQKLFRELTDSGAKAGMNLTTVQQIHLALPPTKTEQELIAKALGDADALIESLEQLIAKKRQIKQGAMQELLTGKKRLPGFERTPGYKQTEAGVVPEDWDVARLGDLFEITSSKRVFQSEWKTEGIPFYRAREIAVLGESGFVDNDLFIGRQMYDAFRRAHGVPKVGDLLVTGVGTLGKVYVVPDDLEFYFKDGNIIWFKITGTISPAYLRQLYLTPAVVKQINDGSAGTTVGTYTISGAKKTVISLPTKAEQESIAATLSDMEANIAALEEKLTKARMIKQGMMQELLTGRTRLI